MKQEMMGWLWHQLDHMQIICTSLQTDKLITHFSQARFSSWCPTNSVKALKAVVFADKHLFNCLILQWLLMSRKHLVQEKRNWYGWGFQPLHFIFLVSAHTSRSSISYCCLKIICCGHMSACRRVKHRIAIYVLWIVHMMQLILKRRQYC